MRIRALALAAGACGIALVLAGCSAESAPPQPKGGQLETLISEVEGVGAYGYSQYHVSFVRFITAKQWQSAMTTCLPERGVTGVVFPPQRDAYNAPSSDQGQLALANALTACSLEYPDRSIRPRLRTAEQWSYQYDYLAHDFVPCVRSEGAEVGGFPGRAAYLSAVGRFEDPPSPYSYVTERPSGVPLSVLKGRCPATAAGL